MATGTIILRPSADITVEDSSAYAHYVCPDGSTSKYLLVNEEEADDSATYIHSEGNGGEDQFISSFIMSGVIPKKNISITNIRFIYRYAMYYSITGSSATDTITINMGDNSASVVWSMEKTDSMDSYVTQEITGFDNLDTLLSELNDYIKANGAGEFSAITLTLYSTMIRGETTKDSSIDAYITQLYLELDYEETDIGVYIKSSGEWLPAMQAFQKVSGAWAEITGEECKTILQNL